MSKYEKVGSISLWKNDRHESNKDPVLKGTVEIGDRKINVSIWKNQSDNPKAPTLKGSLTQEQGADVGGDFDDDIPF